MTQQMQETKIDKTDIVVWTSDVVGSGNFANVFGAVWKTKNVVAVLKIPKSVPWSYEERVAFTNELSVYEYIKKHPKNPMLLTLYGAQLDDSTVQLLLERAPGSTLSNLLKSGKLLDLHRLYYAWQLARVLEYLHSINI